MLDRDRDRLQRRGWRSRDGLPTDVAVTVPVLTVPFVAPAGIATLAQTSSESPGEMLPVVVVSAVVHVASKNVVAQAFVAVSV